MFWLTLTAGLLVGIAFGAHTLAARLLRVQGIPFFSGRPSSGAPTSTRVRRLLVRASGPVAAYFALVLLLLPTLSIRTGFEPRVEAVPGLPAEAAGVETGDLVVDVDGTPIREFEELRALLARSPEGVKRFTVLRGTSRVTLEIAPNAEGRIGVVVNGARLPADASDVFALVHEPVRVFASYCALGVRLLLGTHEAGGQLSFASVRPPERFSGSSASWLMLLFAHSGSLLWPGLVLWTSITAWRQERATTPDFTLRPSPKCSQP